MTITLSKPFASNSAADPADTRRMKRALSRLGYYMPPEDISITEIPDGRVYAALALFQKYRGLSPTGRARPGDETVRALDDADNELDPNKPYIWRSVGDSRFRSSHAAFDGTVRMFSQDPAPGEEPGCRCWAEPAQQLLRENRRGQVCIDNWQRIQRLDREIQDLRDREAGVENQIRQKELEIDALADEINTILADLIPEMPNLKGLDLPGLLNVLDKYVARISLAIDLGRILSIVNQIRRLDEEIEVLEGQLERIRHQIQEKWDEYNDAVESFNVLCPDFFAET